jgi:hypothetical protein
MKLILKLAFPCLIILFLFFCPEDRNSRTKKVSPFPSYGKDSPRMDANIVTPGGYFERRNPPSTEALEEMRRQRNMERSANDEWVKGSVKKYSPDIWYLLMQYENLPDTTEAETVDNGVVSTQKAAETFHFLRGRGKIDLLASMETNVHEIAHAYFDQNVFRYFHENGQKSNLENAQLFLYLSPSRSFFVSFPLNLMFPSAELARVIPKELRTYRFDTYISGTTSTQSEGIIGLLNELNAYYLGSLYSYDMLEPYKEACGSDATGLFEWVTHVQSTMSAFYEFDFFIKEYLLYMRNNYMASYEKLKAYRPFRDSYEAIYKSYSDLVKSYRDRIEKEMKIINASGLAEAKIEKGWLWIRAGKSHISSGTPIFSKEKNILLPALESKKYRVIRKDFRTG